MARLAALTNAVRTLDESVLRAKEAERLGYESVWVTQMPDARDAAVVLAAYAAATQWVRLGTGVLPIYTRHPTAMAQMAASLDVLSGGRLTLGIGAGWLKEEFEALSSPAFNARGAVTDEWITIFKQLWSQSPASFEGRFYRYSEIRCERLGRRYFRR